MPHPSRLISLGFAKEQIPAGAHICQIFKDDDERQNSLLQFLLSGLQAGEQTACFSDQMAEATISDFLGRHGVTCWQAKASGALTLAGGGEIYFQDGRFDPDRMLGILAQYHQDSVRQGYSAARVIGEMPAAVQQTPGGQRLLEYEAKVSVLLREHPVTAVCQYDARSLGGALIMEILKVHPWMVVGSSVVHNPFCLLPEDVLAGQAQSDFCPTPNL